MPLLDVSHNAQEVLSPSRKRTLDEFAQMDEGELPAFKELAGSVPGLRVPADSRFLFATLLFDLEVMESQI
jgi:hypothetical protein